jgi:hypothetical protein
MNRVLIFILVFLVVLFICGVVDGKVFTDNDGAFVDHIKENNQYGLFIFTTQTCPPCQRYKSVLRNEEELLEKNHTSVCILDINKEKNRGIVELIGDRAGFDGAVPVTYMLCPTTKTKDGERVAIVSIIGKKTGYMNIKSLLNWMSARIEKTQKD